MLDASHRKAWRENGYFILRGFAGPDITEPMLHRVVEISRAANGTVMHDDFLVSPEMNLSDASVENAEQKVSKIFRLHRDGPFNAFINSAEVLHLGKALLSEELDCFLSQFIFKNPGAWGQPWHQDAYYFRFDRTPQVGLWLAVTEATLENGCLWVVPGSHQEPVQVHLPDKRPNANFGYMEIDGYDFSGAVPVTMSPGDLLVFHSHLMHRSTDNASSSLRAAMVYHIAEHGTQDISGADSAVNDWMPLP